MKTTYRLPVLMLLCILLFSPSASAEVDGDYLTELVSQADEQELADHEQWHALLHYRSRVFRGVRSDIDSPEFFFSDDGASDPVAELEATLAAFFEPPSAEEQEHPQCRFRARYDWLAQMLDFDAERLVVRDCSDFEAWRDAVAAESVTLLFAAPYLSRPASMFGHTLMLLNRDDDGLGDLDSYVVNVTADPWTYNPLLYTAMGLVGGFDGVFMTVPFDQKLQKYIERERRELWEYELNFNAGQMALLVGHLWELQSYSADYRFLDENCSYFLMSLLEVADPSLTLVEQFGLTVLPGNMVRAVLGAEGLTGIRRFRPSSRQAMIELRGRLDRDEIRLARELGARERQSALTDLSDIDEERQAFVLDAALALWNYRNPPDEETGRIESTWKRSLEQRRGELDVATPAVEPFINTAPEDGHNTIRVSLGTGISQTQAGLMELGIRPTGHDLGSSDVGYRPLSQLQFMNVRIRAAGLQGFQERPTILLQRLDVLDLISLVPLDRWSRNWSWSLKTGLERTYREGCGDSGCLFYDAAFGLGGTVKIGPLATYLMMDTQLAFGSTFDAYTRVAAGPRAGARLQLGRLLRVNADLRYRYPLWGEDFPDPRIALDGGGPPWSAQTTLSVSATQNVELRLRCVAERNRAEANLALNLYY